MQLWRPWDRTFVSIYTLLPFDNYWSDYIIIGICIYFVGVMLEISVLAWIRIIFQSDTIRMKLCSCGDHGFVHLFQFTLCSPLIIMEVIALLLVFVSISSFGVSFLSLEICKKDWTLSAILVLLIFLLRYSLYYLTNSSTIWL